MSFTLRLAASQSGWILVPCAFQAANVWCLAVSLASENRLYQIMSFSKGCQDLPKAQELQKLQKLQKLFLGPGGGAALRLENEGQHPSRDKERLSETI